MTGKTGERWLDIGHFGWLVRYEVHGHHVDFEIFEATARAGAPRNERLFVRKGADNNADLVENPDEAERLEAFVKWDGCCEFKWREEQEHFCGREGLARFGQVLLAVHALTAEVLPTFDREVAGYEPDGDG